MKYASNAPKAIEHEVVLELEDVQAAVLAWLQTHETTRDKVVGVEAKDLNIHGEVFSDGVELSIAWQTDILAVQAPPKPASPMAAAGPMLATQQADGSHRQGKFAVVNDRGDKARTGPIAETFENYDDADTYRHEQPMVSDRASIVWVLKSGSRYTADKRTFARDDEDDEEAGE